MSQNVAIQTVGLSKHYGPTKALQNIDISIHTGELIALLGENGAGKSTLFQLLTGLITPTAGSIQIGGQNLSQNPLACKKRIGLLFGNDSGLYHRLTAYENILYFAKFYDVPDSVARQRIDEWAEQLLLTPHLHKKAGELSKGNLQKTAILRTLIHNPDYLLFDEPTTGLDIAASLAFQDLVKSLQQSGKTILFSTHILEEVTHLTDKIITLSQGKMIYNGTISNLYQELQTDNLRDILRNWIQGGISS
ncbi:sodium transport system ATP-binding protein [Thermoactinomyces sp. DSM 45891]|uniref:ABC transporter ATP-binding protein n=1 Tax=Thermoactinomyces sp. DSM 45891 TaxID=1761907 RepID=UPI00091BA75D|nr:ABC transporter ATP-binding protein [Thermoactinomyces sp. DSM 45891]SFX38506.1 sodium transport system ATP-binding protein [Thermoactinomyces sp. DSM 45891]